MIYTHFDNKILLGDLNYDCLDKAKGETVFDLYDIFDIKNLINNPTCFMKNCAQSLVDAILTNRSQCCFNPFNFGCGISDWHNMIEKQRIKYRSYKNFNVESLNDDVSRGHFMLPMSLNTGMISTGSMNGS